MKALRTVSSRPPLLVVIDGPAGSGKSVITRRLAKALGVPFLYTGAMYRAVTLIALRRQVRLTDGPALVRIARSLDIRFRTGKDGRVRVLVGGRDATTALNHPDISRLTSGHVANEPKVREALVERQRRYMTGRGLVAEGRDCASVVFPRAPYKFYLTASFAERVRRRFADLRKAGVAVELKRIRLDMARRDREDRGRATGALKVMPDAWVVDNTRMRQEETIAAMLRRIRGKCSTA
jgi:cytidylate kinase